MLEAINSTSYCLKRRAMGCCNLKLEKRKLGKTHCWCFGNWLSFSTCNKIRPYSVTKLQSTIIQIIVAKTDAKFAT